MDINKVFDVIESNDMQSLNQILSNGFDVNTSDKDGYTLLHMAVDFGNESAVRVLLSNTEIRVNCYTFDHKLSPIHFASQDGRTHLVSLLLDFGANINSVSHRNCTPLYFAVCANHIQTVKLLLERGADIDIRDTNQLSPLLQAVSISKELTQLLLERKPQMSDYCRELHTSLLSNKADIANVILDSLSPPLSVNRIGRSPLQNAVQHINTDDPQEAVSLVKKMIECGEDINYSNQFGSALHILIQRNAFLNNIDPIDPTSEALFNYIVLLENCELNTFVGVNGSGTPLTLAFKLNKYCFADLLLRTGADVRLCNLDEFKYTQSAESTLKLLFFCGYRFKPSFHSRSRPLSGEDVHSFEVFSAWIKAQGFKIMSLKNLCRIQLRNSYGKSIHKLVANMDCPNSLKQFILFKSF